MPESHATRFCSWQHVGGYKSAVSGNRSAGIYRCTACGRVTSGAEYAEIERQCRADQAGERNDA